MAVREALGREVLRRGIFSSLSLLTEGDDSELITLSRLALLLRICEVGIKTVEGFIPNPQIPLMRPAFEGCHRRAPFKRNAGGKKLEIRLLGDVFFAGDDEIPPPLSDRKDRTLWMDV